MAEILASGHLIVTYLSVLLSKDVMFRACRSNCDESVCSVDLLTGVCALYMVACASLKVPESGFASSLTL